MNPAAEAVADAPHVLGGRREGAGGGRVIEVTCPQDGSVIGRVGSADPALVDRAVAASREAAAGWAAVPVKDRVQVLFRYKALLEEHAAELAALVSRENGKTEGEARAELDRGVEVVEYAAGMPALLDGPRLAVGAGVECSVRRVPVGVAAGITPFNFPAMVPMWMFPIAIGCGNAFVLKPSEQVPFTPVRLAELLGLAGLPAGVLSVLQGGRETVEALLDHPGVDAAAFVGSTPAAEAVYRRGTRAGKRVLALGGAKNHLVVMPDADEETTAANVVSSAMGCAGQRCMAASVLILVGGGSRVLDRVVEKARALVPGKGLGPVISAAARERIVGYVDRAQRAGAKLLLDGRTAAVRDRPGGFFLGPTILEAPSASAECVTDEIFGPVLSVLRVESLDEALAIERRSPFGNAASIYTRDGGAAAAFADRADAGMVGVNVGVPAPRDPFGFGGWNRSKFGAGDLTGEDGVRFWTKAKKTTVKWTGRHDGF